MNMIADLDELALGCTDESARANINEAIKCYQSGAYRSAIVNAYVAVCFDLIEKLRILAAAGDGAAKSAEDELNRLQKQNDEGNSGAITGLLKFERNLLELFRTEFEFFGINEFDELNRLKEDRNRCAHPTFSKSSLPFAPSAELARLHLRNALVHVLTQHPRQGKAALNSLETLITSKHFPSETSEAIKRLNGSEFKNARPALIHAYMDRFCFGAATKGDPLFRKRSAQIAVEAAVDMYRAIALPRLAKNVGKLLKTSEPDAIYVACVFAFRTTEVAEKLDESERAVVKAWVKSSPDTNIGNMICRGFSVSWLSETLQNVLSKLDPKELGKISVPEIPPQVLTHAATTFASAKNWAQANQFAEQFAVKLALSLSEDDLKTVFLAADSRDADLQGSIGFEEFLEALFDSDPGKRARVIELMNEHNLEHYVPLEENDG